MHDSVVRIAENVAAVRQRIDQAARRAGRDPASVRLVAVTKGADEAQTRAVVAAGCRDLGESRPQALWHKAAALRDLDIRWHLVGPLQRNKVPRTLPLVALIHSVDRWTLLEAINAEAAAQQRPAEVLLEVNISGEAQKHGFGPQALPDVLARLGELPAVQVRGLMAMAHREGGADRARLDFSRLRRLRDQLRDAAPPAVSLDELSMGMSGDFEAAIEEGATLVRVGTALLEGLV